MLATHSIFGLTSTLSFKDELRNSWQRESDKTLIVKIILYPTDPNSWANCSFLTSYTYSVCYPENVSVLAIN